MSKYLPRHDDDHGHTIYGRADDWNKDMTTMTLARDSGYTDRSRDYHVLIDGREVGSIGNGEVKSFEIGPGAHSVQLKIDWCSSNSLVLNANGANDVALYCGSSLRGWRILLTPLYVTANAGRYLWLRAGWT